MVGYANDTTIYAVIPEPLSIQLSDGITASEFGANYSWCLKWHMRLNSKKTKSTLVTN